jgi:hypothetical protein
MSKFKGRSSRKGEKIFAQIRTSDLTELFQCSKRTLWRWVRLGRLDPSSLTDIIEKYNNPWMLDKRSLPVDT